MRGPGVAIDATVLATAIGIDACLEADIGAVVVIDDRAGVVRQELGSRSWLRFGVGVRVALANDVFESVGRISRRAATPNWHLLAHPGMITRRQGIQAKITSTQIVDRQVLPYIRPAVLAVWFCR